MNNGRASPCQGSRLRAFTLIELLVVIAIISMLTAILVTGLRQARQAAKRLVCQTDLRTLAAAWTEYLDDNDGYFLQGVNMNVPYGGQQGKGSAAFGAIVNAFEDPEDRTEPVSKPLNMYVDLPDICWEGAEVFHCPTDNGSRTVQPSYFEFVGTSYQTNPMLIGQDRLWYPSSDPCAEVRKEVNDLLRMLNRVRVCNPSKLVLMGDYGWAAAWTPWAQDRAEWHAKRSTHNIAFLDGHVEFLRIRKGVHVTPQYSVIPFKGLQSAAVECQEETEAG